MSTKKKTAVEASVEELTIHEGDGRAEFSAIVHQLVDSALEDRLPQQVITETNKGRIVIFVGPLDV